jgi:hypothetical protein
MQREVLVKFEVVERCGDVEIEREEVERWRGGSRRLWRG